MTKPIIAVTMGDPAGVGPELCLRLLADPVVASRCTPVVLGDAAVLARVADHLGLPGPKQVVALADWVESREPMVVDLRAMPLDRLLPGIVNAATGRASYEYILAAIEAALTEKVDAVTTAPIHKEAINAAGVNYPGHTEIFTERTGAARSCMMLTSDEITCSFVTAHVGLCDVPGLISIERVLDTIELSAAAMSRIRGRAPRLVVCGLNPHAGEHGLFGRMEEEQFILPAVEQARARGLEIVGPLPADTAFLPPRRRQTDCFVCMYHDQGHTVLKALAFDKAVNITLGLPIIRTSVDHGTACDIAWQGVADTSSLYCAVDLACRLASAEPAAERTPQATA